MFFVVTFFHIKILNKQSTEVQTLSALHITRAVPVIDELDNFSS